MYPVLMYPVLMYAQSADVPSDSEPARVLTAEEAEALRVRRAAKRAQERLLEEMMTSEGHPLFKKAKF